MRQIKSNSIVGNFKILVIDDDPAVIDSIVSNLSSEFNLVEGVTNPIEAINKVRENNYDLLITDYQMVPINGDEVVKSVRVFNKGIYILLLTGYAQSAPPLEMYRKLDIQGYCEKGNFDQLLLWVESAHKVVKANKEIYEIKEKLKRLIKFAPMLYKLQAPNNVLTIIMEEIIVLFNEDNAFIMIDDIVNMKYGNKFLYKGIGEFDMTLENFLQSYENINIEIQNVRSTKKLTKTNSGFIIPFKNNYFQNVGIVFLRKNLLDNNAELMEIFTVQLAASLENIFLYQLSVTDGLTGVYNRIFINDYLIKYVFENYLKKVCAIMIDVDNFKSINDRYGHPNGDIALIEVSKIMKSLISQTDIIARFGGEEFIIILTETDIEQALKIAEQIRISIMEKDIELEINTNKIKIHITVSLGISQLIEDDTWSKIIARADEALYSAKSQGKNRREVCKLSYPSPRALSLGEEREARSLLPGIP
jgi:diguanylate cyclase (GGDEF)-like protein